MPKNLKEANEAKEKTPEQNNAKSSSWWMGKQVLISGAALLLVIIGVSGYYFLKDQAEEGRNATESELTYAEELESYKLPEDADQDWINSDRLTLAVAYHQEGDNERALALLSEIENPSKDIVSSIDTLYMDIYQSTGQTDKAAEYATKVIEEKESQYLELAKTDPTGDYELGKLHEIAGNTRKAIEHYGYVADALDKPQEAMESWETAILEKANQGLDRLNT